jgi:ligand-binding sensor domain-containing protein/two-component sensor histidine kinase
MNFKNLFVFLFLLFSATLPLHAQRQPVPGQIPYPPLYFDHLGRENGLPSEVVFCAIQDFEGYIWVGTTNGLARYDGHDMKIFRSIPGDSASLVDNSIYDLHQSKDSLIWIGTGNGLSVYDPNTGLITNFPFDTKKPGGFPARRIYSFHEETDGSLWVGADDGIVVVSGSGRMFRHIRISQCPDPLKREYNMNIVSCITAFPGDQGKLLLGTMGGLLRFDKKTNSVDRDYGGPVLPRTMIRGILPDSNMQVWVFGWGMGLACFDLRKESWKLFCPDSKKITILSLIPKNRDELWLGTDGMGLAIFNKRNTSFFFYKTKAKNQGSVLPDVIHGGAYFNSKQDFWIWGNGIDIENRELFSFKQIRAPFRFWWMSSFFRDGKNDQLFAGAYRCSGMPVFDLKREAWKLINTDFPLPKEGLSVNQFLRDSQNRLWVSTRSGLAYYDREADLLRLFSTAGEKSPKLSDPVVYGLFEDADRNLWAGTRYDGVMRISRDRKRIENFRHIPGDPLSLIEGTHFLSFQADKFNRVWMGCRNGVCMYDPVNKKFSNILMDTLHKYGIKKRWVNGMEKDSLGRIWLAIDEAGLVRAEPRANGSFGIRTFHSGNGMNDPGTGMISKDPDGGFWVLNNGLLYVNPYIEQFQVIDVRNGLHENPSGSSRVYIDKEGNIYLGDSVGFETRNMKDIPFKAQQTLYLKVESTEINGKVSPELLAFRQNFIRELNADQNNLTFHYAAICFHRSGQVHYRYKLIGYDTAWVNAETSKEARYTNLPPGRYSFIVSASQGLGWDEVKQPVQFIIPPHIWQRLWFILACMTLVFAIITVIYRYRVNQLLKVERLRTRIATDLHDDVSSTLSSISILSDIVIQQTEDRKSAGMISEIGNSAKEMLERIDDIIWAVNPSNDTFQDLGLRIREYAIPLFESKNIAFFIDMPERLDDVKLQMDVRRNLYLIAKEAINNLIKYSACSNAWIIFREESSHLVLEVKDDGTGFDPMKKTNRNGLKNMKKRAEQIKGSLEVNSQPGTGTRILLKVRTI